MWYCNLPICIQTAPSFTWDQLANKFIGPTQKQHMDEKKAKEKELELEKQV